MTLSINQTEMEQPAAPTSVLVSVECVSSVMD